MKEKNLKEIVRLAISSRDVNDFKRQLIDRLSLDKMRPQVETMMDCGQRRAEQETILRLIENDGRVVKEASTEQEIKIETISILWHYLRDSASASTSAITPASTTATTPATPSADFLLDISKLFENLTGDLPAPPPPPPTREMVEEWMQRWEVGTDPRIIGIREQNKQRIVTHLIERIDKMHSEKSRYTFPPDIDHDQKQEMVKQWWHDYRFHLAMAARSLKELNLMMGNTLSEQLKTIYQKAHQKGIPIFVTPYYISLMDISGSGYDDSALRSYVLYSEELVNAFGNIKAWEKEDQVEAGKPNAAGWILPEGHNIHRRYPEVAILIPDTVGRACGGLCASCQRLYDFQSGRFNFDLDALKPKESWDSKLKRLMKYFREDEQLRDILITGGDALMSRNSSLRKILDEVYLMAKHKRDDNKARPEGGKYAEIQRVRLGTRLPVYLPMRIDDELISILSDFKSKAETVGIRQFFIQTHFQTPLEITPEVCEGIRRLQSAGWIVTNQTVFNVAASRRGHTARLRQELRRIGVLGYYTFSVKGFEENHSVFAPNSRSLQELMEEKSMFPSLATDRSVLNLPGIGKSLTFNLVGITADGRRILAFDHDHTRRHSPAINSMPIVYIRENKSVGEYLRQLADMGENLSDYETIWRYNSGQTESRYALYEYPE